MKLIGDPHLGRVFTIDVPLDRRGEREEMMLALFEKEMDFADDTVMVGDLFERPEVSLQTLFRTSEIILTAAAKRPNKQIILLAGNHDLDKATDKRGSFHLLASIMERVPNVHVLFTPTVIGDTAYFPWQYEVTAQQQVEELADEITTKGIHRAIGHWDLEDYGGSTDHLCPAGVLSNLGINKIISGHWHVKGMYKVDGIEVSCTGSMQPMTHAEDPDGKLYVTLTLAEYEDTDPAELKDKYVRVELEVGEEVTAPPTCLGFKLKRTARSEEIERVNLGNFDLNEIVNQSLKSHNVTDKVTKVIKENLSVAS